MHIIEMGRERGREGREGGRERERKRERERERIIILKLHLTSHLIRRHKQWCALTLLQLLSARGNKKQVIYSDMHIHTHVCSYPHLSGGTEMSIPSLSHTNMSSACNLVKKLALTKYGKQIKMANLTLQHVALTIPKLPWIKIEATHKPRLSTNFPEASRDNNMAACSSEYQWCGWLHGHLGGLSAHGKGQCSCEQHYL